MSIESGTQFLRKTYDLDKESEVQDAVNKAELDAIHSNQRLIDSNQEGPPVAEKISELPKDRIQTYLDRLQGILEPATREGSDEDFDRADRNLSLIKNALHKNFVIKEGEIPESYWDAQKRIARDEGRGDIEITEQKKEEDTEVIIEDQELSLDFWVDYLASEDATYPLWLKYFALRGVLGMGAYNKEDHKFSDRDSGTVAPFPDLDREALSYVLDAVEKQQGQRYRQISDAINVKRGELKRLNGAYRTIQKEGINNAVSDAEAKIVQVKEQLTSLFKEQADLVSGKLAITDESKAEFRELVQGADFAELYLFALEKITPANEALLAITEGRWVKYEMGSDHMPLVESLQSHGTGWCTAGESMAEYQLRNGDFYVYYSNDEDGIPQIPRAAIRMVHGNIKEVRGIAFQQNLDPYIGKVVQDKLGEFHDGNSYGKKMLDMKLLTYIERKMKAGHALDQDDLIFLYELKSPIEGFGYVKDPRVAELIRQRDPKADAPILLGCRPDQVAYDSSEIKDDTVGYFGSFDTVFQEKIKKQKLRIGYHEFSSENLEWFDLEIGGITVGQLKRDMRSSVPAKSWDSPINYIEEVLDRHEFEVSFDPHTVKLVKLPVSALGLTEWCTLDRIRARAFEMGLEICPAEIGPFLRMKDTQQPHDTMYHIAMEPLPGKTYTHAIFRLQNFGEHDDLPFIALSPATKHDYYKPESYFVFKVREI